MTSPSKQWQELFDSYENQPSIEIKKAPEGTKMLVVSDPQVPLEDRKLLRTIFHDFVPEFLEDSPQSHLFINGDGADNYTLSRFIKRADTKFTFKDEVKAMRGYLAEWGARFSHRHYVMGNHEARYEKYLAQQAPELDGIAPTYPQLLGLKKLGYDFVPYKRYYRILGFIITHGSRVLDNDAKAMLQAYHHSGTSGHTNRPKSWTYANAAGDDPITWYVTGMTCRKDIGDVIDDFKDAVGWQQGFLIGTVHKGILHVENVRVHHGSFLAAGKVYDVE